MLGYGLNGGKELLEPFQRVGKFKRFYNDVAALIDDGSLMRLFSDVNAYEKHGSYLLL